VLRFIRYLASQSHLQEIHFLWRPFLADPDDDMVAELAFAAGAKHIITHNTADFRGSERLGVSVRTPREFLAQIRGNT
jgi:predicted nucleic acid-binding protein